MAFPRPAIPGPQSPWLASGAGGEARRSLWGLHPPGSISPSNAPRHSLRGRAASRGHVPLTRWPTRLEPVPGAPPSPPAARNGMSPARCAPAVNFQVSRGFKRGLVAPDRPSGPRLQHLEQSRAGEVRFHRRMAPLAHLGASGVGVGRIGGQVRPQTHAGPPPAVSLRRGPRWAEGWSFQALGSSAAQARVDP